MKWPAHFPENCPPVDSEPASGYVYRLIEGTIPDEMDFKPYRELSPDRNFAASECQACGLSVYRDLKDVRQLRNRVPRMRRKSVAVGALSPDLGRILNTPSLSYQSHHTWWQPEDEDMKPWRWFRVVTIEDRSP